MFYHVLALLYANLQPHVVFVCSISNYHGYSPGMHMDRQALCVMNELRPIWFTINKNPLQVQCQCRLVMSMSVHTCGQRCGHLVLLRLRVFKPVRSWPPADGHCNGCSLQRLKCMFARFRMQPPNVTFVRPTSGFKLTEHVL
jgi:hypothetical protein